MKFWLIFNETLVEIWLIFVQVSIGFQLDFS